MSDAKNITLNDVLNFVYSASKEDRGRISNALHGAREEDIYNAKAAFRVGDRVMFEPRKRDYPAVVRGVIVRKNPKTFIIRPDGGGREWKVTASFVRKDDQVPPR